MGDVAWLGVVGIQMTPGEDGQLWRVTESLACLTDGLSVEIRPGFVTDGASIPRIAWRLIGCPLRNRHAPAALIHDGLYAAESLPREIADGLFHEALLALGVPRWRAWVMHRAVRLGGGLTWARHTAESIAEARQYVRVER